MPVHEVSPGRYRWGKHGKIGTKAEAEAQARAIYASGYREDLKTRTSRLKRHRALTASRQAEVEYVLALQKILGAVHRAALHVVHREHLHTPPPEPIEHMHMDTIFVSGKGIAGELQVDADPPRVGLGHEFMRRMFRFTKPQTEAAYNKMSTTVARKVDPATRAMLEKDLAKRKAERLSLIPISRPAALEEIVDENRAANVLLIRNASEDFLDDVKDVLEETEGETAESIAAALQGRVGVSMNRALTIARTETLKLNSQIIEHRARAVGGARYKWSTVEDIRVRPEHAELDGEVFLWDDPDTSLDGVENHADVDGGPCHAGQTINCFPEDSEIQFAHGVGKAFRRWFDGDLAVVVTASGRTIRGTPNHPVLTHRGWVALGSLQLTDDVVELAQEHLDALEAHEHKRVTRIGDVFASLSELAIVQALPQLRGADFHGDATEGDVDVVLAARPLSFGILAGRQEGREQLCLSEADEAAAGLCTSRELFIATNHPSHGCMRGGRERHASVGPELGHAEDVRIRTSTDRDASVLEMLDERDTGDASALRDGEQALASLVGHDDGRHLQVETVVRDTPGASVGLHADSPEFLAQVVGADAEKLGNLVQGLPAVQQFTRVRSVDRLPFHGWVLNLETTVGWYAVQGIIGHNCRCLPLPLVEGLDYEEEPDEEAGAEAPEGETEEVEEPDEETEERDAADSARADFNPDEERDEHGKWTAGPGGSKVYTTAPVKAGSQHASHYVKTIPGARIEGGYMGVRAALIHEVHEFSGASGLKAIVIRKDGIKVYKQTDAWKQHQADKKFARAVRMGEKLGGIREAYAHDMKSADAATREKATVLALIDKHCIRVGGSAAELRTGSRGATTIQAKHLHDNPDGTLSIRFPGKSDVRWNVRVTDHQLAANLRAAAAGKKRSAELFPHATPQNVNAYIREKAGTKITAKDFRTFHASVIARAELRKLPAPKTPRQLAANERTAIEHTAAVLGHTPAVCKSSYINPRVLAAYEEDFHHAHAA